MANYGENNIVPIMTSNNAPIPFEASANGDYTWYGITYRAYRAFGGNLTTSQSWVVSGNTGWLKIKLDKPTKVGKYSIRSSSAYTETPSKWKFEGSNDDIEYFELDYVESQTNWTTGEIREFETNSVGEYLYYRVNILANNGNASFTGINRLELFERLTENKTLILSEGSYKKYTPKTPPISSDTNAIPKMTSNTTPSGIASASSISSTKYEPWKAFNGTAIMSDEDAWYTTKAVPQWIQYDFGVGNEKIIGAYKIYDYRSSAYYAKSWIFQGSNDGLVWIDLNTVTNKPHSPNGITFVIDDNKVNKYRIYRLYITEKVGDIGFHEIEMYERLSPATLAFWSTVSSTLPTSEQFLTEGMDSLSPLLDRRVETLEPIKMDSKSDILQQGDIGKVFSKTIDLKKYMDVRTIKVEVE